MFRKGFGFNLERMKQGAKIGDEKPPEQKKKEPEIPDLDRMQKAMNTDPNPDKAKPNNTTEKSPEKTPQRSTEASPFIAREIQKTRKEETQPEINQEEYKVKSERENIKRNWDDMDLPKNFKANTWTTVVDDISTTFDRPTRSHNTLVKLKEIASPLPERKFPGEKCHKDHEYKVIQADINGENKIVMIADQTEIDKINSSDMSESHKKQEIRKWQANTETWGEKNKNEIKAIKARFDEIFGRDKPGPSI